MNHQFTIFFARFLRRHRFAGVCLTIVIALLVSAFVLHQPQAAAQAEPQSSETVWQFVDESAIPAGLERQLVPQSYRTAKVNEGALRELLGKAPLEFTQEAKTAAVTMALPLPDGSFSRFRIEESPIMEAPLAAQFPEIKTYHGQGLDNPTALVRFDLTPDGFHAMILSERGTVYIDPYAKEDSGNYLVYYKSDYQNDARAFQCYFTEENAATQDGSPVVEPNVVNGTTLRTFRLALAATGEYTATKGGTVPGALAAMATTMNRVNGVYERDLAVRMILIANNNLIIYTSAAGDPYTNNDGFEMLDENQTNLTTVIGPANYDIGHVFSTGGGGVALLGSVCTSSKAQGVTGLSSPVGDVFDIDYVAHEMGHQFGAHHTFNGTTSNCGGSPPNRSSSAAYEPGSGSTIMAYAGICGSQNLQSNSDDYFHVKSLEQIATFISTRMCDVETPTGNTLPIVTAGATVTIPRSTPFTLTATGSDANGDALTYCWEEYDLGPATSPSSPDTDENGAAKPIFRSFKPTASSSRTYPKLSNILNNTTTLGESLPTISRTMNFQVTVRDNRLNGGGIGTALQQVVVSAGAGPFQVTAPNTAVSWTGGSLQTVTWNVNNTDAAPVNCANVRILLSTDGGLTFPTVLLASTPNDGTEAVLVPNTSSSTARVKVEAVGNIFFDVSNVNFSVVATGDSDGDGMPDGVEAQEGRNPLVKDNDIFANARWFVMQQYRDFLGREGDSAGITFWTNQINSGAQTRAQMIDTFFNSPEFSAVNPVARLYFAYFLRIPDYGGLTFWTNQYRAGITLNAISQAFASSQEFQNRYGSLTNTEFVSLVYQNVLGRPADADGLAFWTGQLNSGAMTRGQVMLNFSESQENRQTSFNKVFVVQIYVGMLRRSPEQGGFDFWVAQMNGGRSGLDLINGFLAANEYRNRFLP